MTVVQGAFNEAIRPGFRDAFADEYPSLPAIYPAHVKVIPSEKAFEEWLITTGLATTPVKPEGEPTPMDTPIQIGTVKEYHTTYGLGYGVTHEMMINDLYGVVVDPSSRFLAQSQRDVEERKAHSLFNLGFTTIEGYDSGTSLINASHALQNGTTLGNRPSSDAAFGIGTLQASVERFRKLTTERGLRIRMRPAKVLLPVELEWRGHEILQSSLKPYTANNEINQLARLGLSMATSEYLTSATAWFVLAPQAQMKIFFVWRQKPTQSDDYLESEWIARMFNRSIFSYVAVDWRGIDGSTG